jgi:uncharacterized protein YcaQ
MQRLTRDQARRLALAAQGFTDSRPGGRVDVRHFRRVVDRLGVIQLDSVNVFSRAHFMPFFSRLGPFDRDSLDRWLWRSGEMFEYWGHVASLLPSPDYRLFRWRMERVHPWGSVEKLLAERPEYIEGVLEQVRQRGPLQTSELDEPGARGEPGMWNWSDGKVALEMLFVQGRVTTADRPNFVRLYDVPERVIPARHLEAPRVETDDAQAELILKAARSMGVSTVEDLGDYYRIRMPETRPLVDRLVAEGRLVEVDVEGWPGVGYVLPDTIIPRRGGGTALLSPFDNLIWYRDRVERLWDFFYRIEIYVPEPKRIHGYYVLPFLMDGDLVGRVDLKSDRQAGSLTVKGAFSEPGVDRTAVANALAGELRLVAGWLGLDDVVVSDNGDLASHLSPHL